MNDDRFGEYIFDRSAYSALRHEERKVAKMHPMKRLRETHFWAWFWLTLTIELIVLTLCVLGIIWLHHLGNDPHCALQGGYCGN